MASRLEASMNGSCTEQRDRIIESFIGAISHQMVSQSLCQPRHRCRIRNTYIYCPADDIPPSTASSVAPSTASGENLTVDFVLENELKPHSMPVTAFAQRELMHSLDDVFDALFNLVSDEALTWSTKNSQIVAVSLDSALVQFDMENCSAGQVLNERNPPTCRKCIILPYLITSQTAADDARGFSAVAAFFLSLSI